MKSLISFFHAAFDLFLSSVPQAGFGGTGVDWEWQCGPCGCGVKVGEDRVGGGEVGGCLVVRLENMGCVAVWL